MPQPALHLLLARETLVRWRQRPDAPVDPDSSAAVNAFLHGSLAPDMGSFPGGSRDLARIVHTRRTGTLLRALLEFARTPEQTAFAWGWLTHILADVLVHPIVNDEAARRSRDGAANIVEHVRVEVGIDGWFCWQHAALAGLRLRPAFDRAGYRFLSAALAAAIGVDATPAQLVQMERGLMLFSHGALHFATALARHLCWGETPRAPVPLGPSLLWHTASRLSPRNTVINAYLNPYLPEPHVVQRVEDALGRFDRMLDDAIADSAASLPDYNLGDGSIMAEADRRVA